MKQIFDNNHLSVEVNDTGILLTNAGSDGCTLLYWEEISEIISLLAHLFPEKKD